MKNQFFLSGKSIVKISMSLIPEANNIFTFYPPCPLKAFLQIVQLMAFLDFKAFFSFFYCTT